MVLVFLVHPVTGLLPQTHQNTAHLLDGVYSPHAIQTCNANDKIVLRPHSSEPLWHYDIARCSRHRVLDLLEQFLLYNHAYYFPFIMVGPDGLEPPTAGFEDQNSIQLS